MAVLRHYSIFDKLCLGLDQVIRALTDNVKTTGESYPAEGFDQPNLTQKQRKHSAALLRIDHAGEICAQALYHGQSVVSNSKHVQDKLEEAALEEGNHLAWCKRRLDELNSYTSYLNPLWYTGSFCIGMVAGLVGDEWSLGFVAETERQVVKHLSGHLHLLPMEDQPSYKILAQMERDEAKHRDEAIALGAKELPEFIKKTMSMMANVMVKTAYWV